MPCPTCGLPATAPTCPRCGTPTSTAPTSTGPTAPAFGAPAPLPPAAIGYAGPVAPPAPFRSRLAGAIVALVLFWPTGLPAVIFAAKANGHAAAGHLPQAHEAAKTARTLSIISWVVGALASVAAVFVFVVMAALGAATFGAMAGASGADTTTLPIFAQQVDSTIRAEAGLAGVAPAHVPLDRVRQDLGDTVTVTAGSAPGKVVVSDATGSVCLTLATSTDTPGQIGTPVEAPARPAC